MTFFTMARTWGLAILLGLGMASSHAGEVFPSQPVRIIVPYAPGGGTDMIARLVGKHLSDRWGVPVVVDNRPGSNTLIGAQAVARSAPDGHTLLLTLDATFTMNPSLYSSLPYDPHADFDPVVIAAKIPLLVAAHPDSGITDIADLVRKARAAPGSIAYAHGAMPAQVAGEMFKLTMGVDLLAVPYRGGSLAVADTMAGVVPVLFDSLGPTIPHIQAGRLRPLAITSQQRSPSLPEVPTMVESGVKDYVMDTWVGIFAPAGTPADRLATLERDIVGALRMAAVSDMLAANGIDVVAGGRDELARAVTQDAERFSAVIHSAGIHVE